MADMPTTVPGHAIPTPEAFEPFRGTCIAFILLTTLFFALRTVSRLVIGRVPWGWDDTWIVPAWIFSIGIPTLGLVKADAESKTVPVSNMIIQDPYMLIKILKIVFAVVHVMFVEFATTRLSVFCLYLRLFRGKKIRIVCWTFIGIVVAQYIAYFITGFVQCRPVKYFWDKTIKGECVNLDHYYRYTIIPNIIIDFFMVLIPVPTVWQLKASKLRKTGLTLIFGWSVVALVASVIRLKIFLDLTVAYFAPNFTVPLMTWLIVEPGLYFIAACLPAMHHILAKMVPSPVHDRLENALAVTSEKFDSSNFSSNFSVKKPGMGKGVYPLCSGGSQDEDDCFTQLQNPQSAVQRGRGGHGAVATVGDTSLSSGADLESGKSKDRSQSPVLGNNLSPNDMRLLKMGEGIAVRTDIITQEEQIEQILGF